MPITRAIAQSDYNQRGGYAAQTQVLTAVFEITRSGQGPSPLSPAGMELEDFKYFFTASVRPRT